MNDEKRKFLQSAIAKALSYDKKKEKYRTCRRPNGVILIKENKP